MKDKEMLIMLIQFSVRNYMSIRDEAILSLSAGSGKEHEENIRIIENAGKKQIERVLPSVAIYGANAAGKSNLFKAMTAAILAVRNSNVRSDNTVIPGMIPFLLDEENRNKPVEFEFIFSTEGHKYQYGFSADMNRIYDEYLYEYKSSRPSVVFERTNTNIYSFTETYKGKLNKFIKYNTENKLFLSTATNWNSQLTRPAYNWLASGIDTYNERSFDISLNTLSPFDEAGDELNTFVRTLLRNADINISDYDLEIEKTKGPVQLPPGIEISPSVAFETKSYKVSTKHTVVTENGNTEYSLPLDAESEGTKKIFAFAPIIKLALESGKTLVIDEIDNSLHPLLLEYIINLFNNANSNPNNAQLVFNTHAVEVLSLDYFRRDQIYFAEKDNDTGATELYSLDEFSPRKSENIRKGYLLGRYGAVPNIGWEDLN